MLKLSLFQYCGAIHIHTKFSDGTGDINSICKAAKKAGLDWIIITDHNKMEVEEGVYNGVFVITGEEISPEKENHYLALDINQVVEPCDNPQRYVDKVRELGGFGFAAHPDEGITVDKKGNVIPRKNSNHCIPWTDKNIKPDGVELWNWFSNWADNYDDSSLLTKASSFFFKHSIIKNPSCLTLEWWDKLNNETEKVVPALGGVDAHALKISGYIIPLTVFPYITCFKTVNNIINLREPLSKDFNSAKQQILSAVKNGNNIIINRNICKYVPNFCIHNGENVAFPGDTIDLTERTQIKIKTRKKTNIKIILNGKELYNIFSEECLIPVNKSGKYRIEFLSNRKGFAYTNPVVVK